MLDFFKNIDFDSISTWLKDSFNPLMLIIGCSLNEKTKRWFSVPFYFSHLKRFTILCSNWLISTIEIQFKRLIERAIKYALSDPNKAYNRLNLILYLTVPSKRRREEILLTILLTYSIVSIANLIFGNKREKVI